MKPCRRCKAELPLEAFRKRGRKRAPDCRACWRGSPSTAKPCERCGSRLHLALFPKDCRRDDRTGPYCLDCVRNRPARTDIRGVDHAANVAATLEAAGARYRPIRNRPRPEDDGVPLLDLLIG